MNKNQLRKLFRERRRALSIAEQQAASLALTKQFFTCRTFDSFQHIGLYICNDGELDLQPLIEQLWAHNKCCYLPKLDGEQLLFSTYTHTTDLIQNRYSIAEPESTSVIRHIQELDLILMPLVAFSLHGERLGMGSGYYDKTLAQYDIEQRPLLIGCAHDIQCAESLPQDQWDIQLDGILTPTRTLLFNNRKINKDSA